MKLNGLFGLIFTLLLIEHAVAQTSLCGSSTSINNINTEILAQENIPTKLNLEEIISNKTLILAGEAHYHTNTHYLSKMIEMFAEIKGTSACIAFEFSKRSYQFSEMLQNISNNIELINTELQSNNLDEDTRSYYKQMLTTFTKIQSYYGPLDKTAVNKGLKTFAVDHEDHDLDGEASYSDRNKAMAENLEDLIASNKCTSVLYFVGKAHLSNSLGTTDKIQDYLSLERLESSLTLNIQMTREVLMPFVGRTWAGCKPPAPRNPVIFKSEIIDGNISVMPFLIKPMPLMIDYDFTYLLPNE